MNLKARNFTYKDKGYDIDMVIIEKPHSS